MEVREARPEDRDWISGLLVARWGSTRVVSNGQVHDAAALPAYLAEDEGELVGLVTYDETQRGLEVVSIDALPVGRGAGTALIDHVKAHARARGIDRIWLITTNDNLRALRFYQRRGFRLVEVRVGGIDRARELKPSIPVVGADGIEVHDEIELAYRPEP